MGKLDGKVAMITGCAGGLGKQHAIRFAHEGANLAICDILEERLMETKRLCQEKGAEVLALRCDVGLYDDLVTFVEKTAECFGTIDVLVNNAHTVTPLRPFLEYGTDDLDIELHTSLYAVWHLMKLCFPYMKDKPGAGASIINVASMSGTASLPSQSAYATAKEAIRGLSRVVAREWGQYNIRVNTICPGGWTENMADHIKKMKPDNQEFIMNALSDNPFQRMGDPYNDVSPVFVFLASDDSHWITGQNLHADGGSWISP